MKMPLAMYKALKAINMPEPKIEAVIQVMEPAVLPSPASKSDFDIAQFRAELARFEVSLINNIGVMIFSAVAVLFVWIAFIH
ncbi:MULTISPECIES: hypothetical protein [unclassified Pseudomonas]|uniref:hypothetical protein n=1 Tax=unclassified Pseudomonas TaxID=196821 RepID=UPI0005960ECD|nr:MULTISPECIES: hypothetical protein [unclassified Pseudomonas]MBD0685001.1 hypothetical protein [Pseudomonas sp. PSB18]